LERQYLQDSRNMRTLIPEQAMHFLDLHRKLIIFTNNKYKICAHFQNTTDLENLDELDIQNQINPIRKKMYQHDNIKQFCSQNPFKLEENELRVISEWTNHHVVIKGYLVNHLATQTVLMTSIDGEDRLYGIKSITSDLADMIPQKHLPIMGDFILLPFIGNIIYDGFCNLYNISFGSGIRKDLAATYNQAKALCGIYSEHRIGDDLSNPPHTATIKETVKYSISQSLKRGEFPQRAFALADHQGMRSIFEKEYTARYLTLIKRNLKTNDEIPKMHYAAYRESIIGVMPSKKDLENFCKENYKNILEYITIFTV
jgi:hypothetical protein